MDKKDLYEHLANIYLDASAKRKSKKPRKHPDFFKHLFFASLGVIILLTGLLFSIPFRYKHIISSFDNAKLTRAEFALVLQPRIIKINFDFQPAKEEIYSIDLNNLDLSKFKELGFSVRKARFEDNITLIVEVSSTTNQRSKVYLNEIPSFKWMSARIRLKDFKQISDWSKAKAISFIVEEGNSNTKDGIVYIDEVRLIK